MRIGHILVGVVVLLMSAGVCGAATPAVSLPGALSTNTVQFPKGRFAILCFHDVRDDVSPDIDRDPDAINTRNLAEFFDWMQSHGWHPVSVDQILAAHRGGPALPANPVLLSFDDGLESVYTRAFPLLKAFKYPAVVALETGWLRRVHGDDSANGESNGESAVMPLGAAGSRPPHHRPGAGWPEPTRTQQYDEAAAAKSSNLQQPGKVFYNGVELGANGFLTWGQVNEMENSGLVEIATHTDDLHHGILANPQGNSEPAAITRLYHPRTQTYETHREFRRRIRDDLARSIDIIRAHTGRAPRIVVWPYGAMTPEVESIARGLGLSISFGLGDDRLPSIRHVHSIGRFLVLNDSSPTDIEAQVATAIDPPKKIVRALQIDLDDIYDPSPAQVNENLGKLLDRVKAMNVTTVYLQAFADPDGDGTASALYFPNHYLPMRADLFNRVAWQLKTRAGVQVYAWLPLLAFDLPDGANTHALAVKVAGPNGEPEPTPHDYRRLSPFLPQSLKLVSGIYEDLAQDMSGINGVLIHDDAYLDADEDLSACEPQARWPGTDRPIADCHLDAPAKTQALIDFGQAVVDRMKTYRNVSNSFGVARNLYARVVMDPGAEAQFSQSLPAFLRNYDYVALMAMPYLDETRLPPTRWLIDLEQRVAQTPGALNKVVFELQTRNWKARQWIPGDTLLHWMKLLVARGAVNLGYYPDDFLSNHPPFKQAYEGMSLNSFPGKEVPKP